MVRTQDFAQKLTRADRRRDRKAEEIAESMASFLAENISTKNDGEAAVCTGLPHQRHVESFGRLVDAKIHEKLGERALGDRVVLDPERSANATQAQYDLDPVYTATDAPAVLVYVIDPANTPETPPVFHDPLHRY